MTLNEELYHLGQFIAKWFITIILIIVTVGGGHWLYRYFKDKNAPSVTPSQARVVAVTPHGTSVTLTHTGGPHWNLSTQQGPQEVEMTTSGNRTIAHIMITPKPTSTDFDIPPYTPNTLAVGVYQSKSGTYVGLTNKWPIQLPWLFDTNITTGFSLGQANDSVVHLNWIVGVQKTLIWNLSLLVGYQMPFNEGFWGVNYTW
jgi:hypothetical protein